MALLPEHQRDSKASNKGHSRSENPSPLDVALALHRAGYSVLPIKRDGTKHPAISSWKPLQTERMSETAIRKYWEGKEAPPGVAVAGGAVSGSAECIDFDRDADCVFPLFCDIVNTERPELLGRLAQHKTPNGYHLWHRCPEIEIPSNTKLAEDPSIAGGAKTIIETRGTGGYALVPGCPRQCHPSQKLYCFVGGTELVDLQPITAEDREVLIRVARFLGRKVRPADQLESQPDDNRPGTDYDFHGPPWPEILSPHGWEVVREYGRVLYLRRPDKEGNGHSATAGHCHGKHGEELLKVFSSSAFPFESGRCYGKFRTYALLRHNGDLSKAASDLRRSGYGRDKNGQARPAAATNAPSILVAPGSTQPKPDQQANDASAATRLFNLIKLEAEPFKDDAGRAWLRYRTNGRYEVSLVDSQGSSDFVRRLIREKESRILGQDSLTSVLAALGEIARCEGKTYPVPIRVAMHEGNVYLDLADAERRIVRMTPNGYEVLNTCDVRFRRPAKMKALPVPRSGGSLEELRCFVNVTDDAQWLLIKAWLVNALWPGIEKAHLVLTGQQGTAKSTTARILQSLIDPNQVELRADPRDEQALAIAADGQWVMAFDNLSRMPPWLSDSLCRLSTGGTVGTRQLYTAGEEQTWTAIRPVILTSIEELATNGDLLDRSILAELPVIERGKRVTREEIEQEWELSRPHVLGALCEAVCCALRKREGIKLKESPRLASFAYVAVAAGEAAGYDEAAFISAYRANEKAGHELALEIGPLYPVLRSLLAGSRDKWEGTVPELLAALNMKASEEARRQPGWPKDAARLGKALSRLAPALAAAGLVYERPRQHWSKASRLVCLRVIETG